MILDGAKGADPMRAYMVLHALAHRSNLSSLSAYYRIKHG
jgi:hypothetical protein